MACHKVEKVQRKYVAQKRDRRRLRHLDDPCIATAATAITDLRPDPAQAAALQDEWERYCGFRRYPSDPLSVPPTRPWRTLAATHAPGHDAPVHSPDSPGQHLDCGTPPSHQDVLRRLLLLRCPSTSASGLLPTPQCRRPRPLPPLQRQRSSCLMVRPSCLLPGRLSFSMPDTPDLRAAFGQSGQQAEGCRGCVSCRVGPVVWNLG